MRNFIAKIFMTAALPLAYGVEGEECVKPWVYFDLGNTIVDTKTHDYKPMFYMRDVAAKTEDDQFVWKDGKSYKTAQDYVNALKGDTYKLGMLIDVPEAWGVNYPAHNPIRDYPSAKIFRTLDFLAGKVPEDNATWMEGEPTFDYFPFGNFEGSGADRVFVGELILPQKDSERKSKGSKVVFERAVAHAAEQGCKAIYQGEDPDEMKLAEEAGMYPFQVGVTSKTYFYIPIEKLADYVKNYKPGQHVGLGDDDFE